MTNSVSPCEVSLCMWPVTEATAFSTTFPGFWFLGYFFKEADCFPAGC